MKPLSETYKQLGIDFTFPIEIKDSYGNETYHEDSEGYWRRRELNANGYVTYNEDSNGFWCRWGRDDKGKETYFESSNGLKRGTPKSTKTCEGKVVEVDGIKYKLTAL